MIELVFMVARTGEFFQDIALPAVVGACVLLWIGNSLLKHFGYYLW